MKLIIQIPCLDEEQTLPVTLAGLPRELEGFDVVEWLVIDDGSRDATVEVARAHGVDHIVRLPTHRGLAAAFQAGLDAALKLGADVIVNTDADNQYDGRDIAALVAPVLAGETDIVIGDRNVATLRDSSWRKRLLYRLGAWTVRRASGSPVPDPTSGFRAYSREAAISLQVVSSFTYTLESVIQAGRTPAGISHVPVRTNPDTRPSRLFPSISAYVRRNALQVFRSYSYYEPLRIFWGAALIVGIAAAGVWGRFLYLWIFAGSGGRGHVQSLILGAALFNAAMLLGALGVIGDLLYAQRVVGQRTAERVRRIELALGVPPSHYEPGAPDEEAERPLEQTPEPRTPARL